jgi:1,4-dihydroxy-2-naphthoate octaprenyltransferase
MRWRAARPLRLLVAGARPRTLGVALVPVAVATGLAAGTATARPWSWPLGLASLGVAVALQVAANLANDYGDGRSGVDAARVGPARLVASGAASASFVRNAALAWSLVAAGLGTWIAAVRGWWLLGVGAAALLAAWAYSVGPRPYSSLGLGELFVAVFFGGVATVGTVYAELGRVPAGAWLAWLFPAGTAIALLEANNLRDLATDAASGKRTLAVRIGGRRAPLLYPGALVVAALGVVGLACFRPWAALALLVAPAALHASRRVLAARNPRELLPVLRATARVQVVGGLLLALGAWR